MAAPDKFIAELNYYDYDYGWANEGTASQGRWSGTGPRRCGVIYFPGLAAKVKGKKITGISMAFLGNDSGNSGSKTAYIFKSYIHGRSVKNLSSSSVTGDSFKSAGQTTRIGLINGNWYNRYCPAQDVTDIFAERFSAGEDTFCIYAEVTAAYFKWTQVEMWINYVEDSTSSDVKLTEITKFTDTAGNQISEIEMGKSMRMQLKRDSSTTFNTEYIINGTAKYINSSQQSSTGITWGPVCGAKGSTTFWNNVALLPNAQYTPDGSKFQGIMTIRINTFSGGKLVGSTKKDITLKIPTDDNIINAMRPIVRSLQTSPYPSSFQNYMQGRTGVRMIVEYEGQHGGIVQGYDISANNAVYSGTVNASSGTFSRTTPELLRSGQQEISVTVKDSRGLVSDPLTYQITAETYIVPKVEKFTAERLDNGKLYVYFKGSRISSILNSSGQESNVGKFIIDCTSNDGIVDGITNETFPPLVRPNGPTFRNSDIRIEDERSYTVKVVYGDNYTTTIASTTLPRKGNPIEVAHKGQSVGIGITPDVSNSFHVGWDSYFHGLLSTEQGLGVKGTASICEIPQGLGGGYVLSVHEKLPRSGDWVRFGYTQNIDGYTDYGAVFNTSACFVQDMFLNADASATFDGAVTFGGDVAFLNGIPGSGAGVKKTKIFSNGAGVATIPGESVDVNDLLVITCYLNTENYFHRGCVTISGSDLGKAARYFAVVIPTESNQYCYARIAVTRTDSDQIQIQVASSTYSGAGIYWVERIRFTDGPAG